MSNITSSESFSTRAAFWLTGCATVAVLFSIAASQILLALALIALLFSGVKLRFPPLVLPLALLAGSGAAAAPTGEATGCEGPTLARSTRAPAAAAAAAVAAAASPLTPDGPVKRRVCIKTPRQGGTTQCRV